MQLPNLEPEQVRAVRAWCQVPAPEQAPPSAADWDRLRDKLVRACTAAPELPRSVEHGWHLRAPLREAEVADCEARLGARLPDDYRHFVRHLADAAPAPFGRLRRLSVPDEADALAARAWASQVVGPGGGSFGACSAPGVAGTLGLGWHGHWGGGFVLDLRGPNPGCVGASTSASAT